MRTLLIDIGNSRLKLRYENEEGELIRQTYDWRDQADKNENWISDLLECITKPDRFAISNVAAPALTLAWQHAAQKNWDISPYIAKTQAELNGLKNSYTDPEALGVDRWLAMLGAWFPRKKTVCVIDAGSALTIDYVTKNGQHRGGLIMPGFRLLAESLTQKTHALEAPASPQLSGLADNTQSAIQSGCSQFFVQGVAGILQQLEQENRGQIEYIITGGDAAFLTEHLPFTLHYEPELVLHGLELSIPAA